MDKSLNQHIIHHFSSSALVEALS